MNNITSFTQKYKIINSEELLLRDNFTPWITSLLEYSITPAHIKLTRDTIRIDTHPLIKKNIFEKKEIIENYLKKIGLHKRVI